MGKVFYDVSISLDRFVSGANVHPEARLGDGGEQLSESKEYLLFVYYEINILGIFNDRFFFPGGVACECPGTSH